jgi:hypothetical protein
MRLKQAGMPVSVPVGNATVDLFKFMCPLLSQRAHFSLVGAVT